MSIFGIEIRGLTPPVLMELADHVDEFAQQLRRTANENERRLQETRNHHHHYRSVKAATVYFSKLVESGTDTIQALEEASAKHCVPKDAVSMYVTLYKAKQKKLEKEKRDRKVMQLWRAGHPLQHVAKTNNITVRTVNRIVAEHRDI